MSNRLMGLCFGLFWIASCSVDAIQASQNIDYKELQFRNEFGFYNGKLFSGLVIAYFDNGNKMFQSEYLNGIDHGVFKEWNINGNLVEVSRLERGKLQGKFRRFYPNGQRLFEGHYISDQLNGEAKEWYPGGELKSRANYVNGLESGEYLFYDKSGKLILKGIMKSGRRDGIWFEFNQLNERIYQNKYNMGELLSSSEVGK